MKNTTEYTSEEVLAALVKYHKGRVPFDDKGFEAIPAGFGMDGSWTVVTKERPKETAVKESTKRGWAIVIKLLEWVVRRWA